MKAKKSIVICRTDDTHSVTIVTEKKKGTFFKPTAAETLVALHAGLFKAICLEIYDDQRFQCNQCKMLKFFTHYAGVMLDNRGNAMHLCRKCAGKMGENQA